MRFPRFTLTVLAACCFVGCTTYGDLPIYGAAHLLSSADYHAALVVTKRNHPNDKIHLFQVASKDEVHLYYTPQTKGGYWILTRTKGHWEESGGTIVIEEPILFNGHLNE